MIQTTQIAAIETETRAFDQTARIFVTCTVVGALVGAVLSVQIINETLGTVPFPILVMTGFSGSTVGGVSALLVATLADVIFGGRLEETAFSEDIEPYHG